MHLDLKEAMHAVRADPEVCAIILTEAWPRVLRRRRLAAAAPGRPAVGMDLLCSARKFRAPEALSLGLVNRVIRTTS